MGLQDRDLEVERSCPIPGPAPPPGTGRAGQSSGLQLLPGALGMPRGTPALLWKGLSRGT